MVMMVMMVKMVMMVMMVMVMLMIMAYTGQERGNLPHGAAWGDESNGTKSNRG